MKDFPKWLNIFNQKYALKGLCVVKFINYSQAMQQYSLAKTRSNPQRLE